LLVVACAVLGLVVGSFLNVVIHRLPRGESVVRPVSRCPRCGNPVRPRDNVPLISWLVLRGRCRDCAAGISRRYPLIELLTAAAFAAMAMRFGASTVLPAYLYLAAVGIALAAIDLDVHRLPNALTLPSYPVGVVLLGAAALSGDGAGRLVRALLGMAALFGLYFAVAFAYPAGMGFGDVKLAGVLGLYLGWLGWDVWAVGLFLGFLLGGIVGLGLMAVRRAGRKTALPFGPFMITGAAVAILFGGPLGRLWLGVAT
jgi:leader peptidase (prepilin peptidase) / N-methyltransferase